MIEALSQMLWPLLACFVLVGIHAYLGIHVLARKVIFVDLALAQIAALGAVYGVFMGLSLESDPWSIKIVSVIFTLFGALLFSFTRTHDEHVPHEAIIGIIYAAALSMTLLITADLPHGADEVRQLLAGNILWVTKEEVMYTALLYAAVGAVHIIFRKQFFLLSDDIAERKPTSINIKLWDFLFYATFGVVVTSSVGIGGVLLVFGYLVIPSVIAVMLAKTTRVRLIIGWGSGLIMSFVGVVVSYYLDLPSGPAIVVLLGALLLAITLGLELANRTTWRSGLIHILLIASILVLAVGPYFYQRVIANNVMEKKAREHLLTHGSVEIEELRNALKSKNSEEISKALTAAGDRKLDVLLPDIMPFLFAADDKQRELAVNVLRTLGDTRAIPHLEKAARMERDVFIKIEIADTLLALGDKEGLFILSSIMNVEKAEFARTDAATHLEQWLPDAPEGAKELAKWLEAKRALIQFDQAEKKYHVGAQ